MWGAYSRARAESGVSGTYAGLSPISVIALPLLPCSLYGDIWIRGKNHSLPHPFSTLGSCEGDGSTLSLKTQFQLTMSGWFQQCHKSPFLCLFYLPFIYSSSSMNLLSHSTPSSMQAQGTESFSLPVSALRDPETEERQK